jgi:hypothetical protein
MVSITRFLLEAGTLQRVSSGARMFSIVKDVSVMNRLQFRKKRLRHMLPG